MNRRGFLGSILSLGVAPAIVRADTLMRVVPRDTIISLDPALKPSIGVYWPGIQAWYEIHVEGGEIKFSPTVKRFEMSNSILIPLSD